MHNIPYDITHFSYTGDTLGSLEHIKSDSTDTYWEANTPQARLVLTFPPTPIHELRLALRSSAALLVSAGGDEMVTLLEKTEYLTEDGLKKVKYANTEYVEKEFTRLELEITNLVSNKPLSLAYFLLYRSGESLKRKAESTPRSLPVRRPKLTVPPVPLPARPLQQEPAECSYSALLRDCQVFSLDERPDHIRSLCACLGACWVEHLADATHVILTSQLGEVMKETKSHSSAKFVTVEWLEGCLRDRERKSEAEFALYGES